MNRRKSFGFTLMELLVVIAVMAVLAAASLTLLDPLKKIRQAQDGSNKNQLAQIGGALANYFAINHFYPASLSDLVTAKELKNEPVTASGANFNYAAYSATGGNCSTAGGDCVLMVSFFTLLAPNNVCPSGQTAYWAYTSESGKAGKVCKIDAPAPSDVPTAD